jgi:hypothetical protein
VLAVAASGWAEAASAAGDPLAHPAVIAAPTMARAAAVPRTAFGNNLIRL